LLAANNSFKHYTAARHSLVMVGYISRQLIYRLAISLHCSAVCHCLIWWHDAYWLRRSTLRYVRLNCNAELELWLLAWRAPSGDNSRH